MNMNKALQHLYKAVSGQDTSKVNISKLLVDIHKALTGKDSANRNNWARIIDSMAENWSGGGGGSSDFSTATVTATYGHTIGGAFYADLPPEAPFEGETYFQNSMSNTLILYKGVGLISIYDPVQSISGNIQDMGGGKYVVTGDCTITFA